jgi:hypothetical protein
VCGAEVVAFRVVYAENDDVADWVATGAVAGVGC